MLEMQDELNEVSAEIADLKLDIRKHRIKIDNDEAAGKNVNSDKSMVAGMYQTLGGLLQKETELIRQISLQHMQLPTAQGFSVVFKFYLMWKRRKFSLHQCL